MNTNLIDFNANTRKLVEKYRKLKGYAKDEAMDGDQVDEMAKLFTKVANEYQGNI